MITQFILVGIFWLLTALFSLFSLPAMPLLLVQAANSSIQFLSVPIGVVRNYLGDDFFFTIFLVFLFYISFNYVWYMTVWIYQRIRG